MIGVIEGSSPLKTSAWNQKTRNWHAKKEEIDDHLEKQARSTRHTRSPRSIKGNRRTSCIRR